MIVPGSTHTRRPSRVCRLHGLPARPDTNGTTVPAVSSVDITKAEIKTVPVGDITIAWKEAGSGEPLILITGYAGTMDLWDTRLVNQLAQHYRVIVFDNRGMGNSTSSDRDYSIRLFANDTAGLMDALGIKKAHVMGWSMGTFVAQELALGYPEKVDKLILYAGTPGGNEAVPPSPEVIAVLTNTTGTDRERGERLFGELFPPGMAEGEPGPFKIFPESHRNERGRKCPAAGCSNRGLERHVFPAACPASSRSC